MNTTDAPAIPGAITETGEYLFCKERQLWRLPVGTVFEDWYHKQLFEKVAEIITSRGRRHVLQCLASPFPADKEIGPICAAFFCTVGNLVYREGSLPVFVRAEPKES